MNRTQKTIILIAIFCIVAMVIYPPWVRSTKYLGNMTTRPCGYTFICLPPDYARFIDLYRLSAQLVGVLIFATGLCFVCSTTKRRRADK